MQLEHLIDHWATVVDCVKDVVCLDVQGHLSPPTVHPCASTKI